MDGGAKASADELPSWEKSSLKPILHEPNSASRSTTLNNSLCWLLLSKMSFDITAGHRGGAPGQVTGQHEGRKPSFHLAETAMVPTAMADGRDRRK